MGALTRLMALDLAGQGLKGTVPAALAALTALTSLCAAAQGVGGGDGVGWGGVEGLRIAHFPVARLTRTVPPAPLDSHLSLVSPRRSVLSNNLLEGTLPAFVATFAGLATLCAPRQPGLGPPFLTPRRP